MDSHPGLIRLALFGSPVRQSLSPRIHGLLAEQADLQIDYQCHETMIGGLQYRLSAFAAAGGRGCNITVPLKMEAIKLATRVSELVTRAQAANTLLLDSCGRWHADNTDGPGLMRDLMFNHSIPLRERRIAIIGAGGAAAGILPLILEEQPAEVILFNRTFSSARDLAGRHEAAGPVRAMPHYMDEKDLAFDLVINATSMGHSGEVPQLSRSMFSPDTVCYDLNYGVAASPLGQWCKLRNISYVDGLGMLVEQAIESFRIWTGYEAESRPVIKALREDS